MFLTELFSNKGEGEGRGAPGLGARGAGEATVKASCPCQTWGGLKEVDRPGLELGETRQVDGTWLGWEETTDPADLSGMSSPAEKNPVLVETPVRIPGSGRYAAQGIGYPLHTLGLP